MFPKFRIVAVKSLFGVNYESDTYTGFLKQIRLTHNQLDEGSSPPRVIKLGNYRVAFGNSREVSLEPKSLDTPFS